VTNRHSEPVILTLDSLRARRPSPDAYGVPPGVFQNFLAATSKGQFANWQIKPYYRYRRVD